MDFSILGHSTNLFDIAHGVYRERRVLNRIDLILSAKRVDLLDEGTIKRLRKLFVEHLTVMSHAQEDWKLDRDLLNECIAHLERKGYWPGITKDLDYIRRVEELLSAVTQVGDMLESIEQFDEEAEAYLLDLDDEEPI